MGVLSKSLTAPEARGLTKLEPLQTPSNLAAKLLKVWGKGLGQKGTRPPVLSPISIPTGCVRSVANGKRSHQPFFFS